MMEIQRVHVEHVRCFRFPSRFSVCRRINRESLSVDHSYRTECGIRGCSPVCFIDERLYLLPLRFGLCFREDILIQMPEFIIVIKVVSGQVITLESYLRFRVVFDLDNNIIIIKNFLCILIRAEVSKAEENRFIWLYGIRADLNRRS